MFILSFIVPILVVLLVLKLLALPFKIITKVLVNSILGGIILLILGFLGIGIVITWWLIALTGLLGIPGLIIGIIISAIL